MYPVSCPDYADGMISINIEGNHAPFQVTWTDPHTSVQHTSTYSSAGTYLLQDLASGEYSLVITDQAGRTWHQTVSLKKPEPLILETRVLQDATCKGLSNGAATVIVKGGAGGYSYHWINPYHTSASVSGLPSGMYVVVVKDQNGCEAAEAVTIINEESLKADPIVVQPSSPNRENGAVKVIAENARFTHYDYVWNTPQQHTTAEASGLAAGTYEVTVADLRGCQATAQVTLADRPSGLPDLELVREHTRIAPNPTADLVTVTLPGNDQAVELGLIDYTGRQVQLKRLNSTTAQFDLRALPQGRYTLFMKQGNERFSIKQIVRE